MNVTRARLVTLLATGLALLVLFSASAQSGGTLYLPVALFPASPTPTLPPTATATLPATAIPATPTPTEQATIASPTPTEQATAAPPTPTPPPPTGNNLQCRTQGNVELCAWVSNGTPLQNSSLTVYGRLLVDGAPWGSQVMSTTWHYKTTTSACTGVTGATGIASCTRAIGRATVGYPVTINVTLNGYQVATWFTPR